MRSLNSSKSLHMESGMWPGRDDYDWYGHTPQQRWSTGAQQLHALWIHSVSGYTVRHKLHRTQTTIKPPTSHQFLRCCWWTPNELCTDPQSQQQEETVKEQTQHCTCKPSDACWSTAQSGSVEDVWQVVWTVNTSRISEVIGGASHVLLRDRRRGLVRHCCMFAQGLYSYECIQH